MSEVPLTAHDMPALALGCDLLGSGGGGPAAIARPIVTHLLAESAPVQLLADPEPDLRVACVGAYGAATVMLESLPTPSTFVAALRELEGSAGPVDAVLPLEVGGVNGLLAVMVAAATGLPLVDADPMGRAFSAIEDTVLATRVPLRSAAFASPLGHRIQLSAAGVAEIERPLRSLLPAVGGWGALAAYAARADELVPSCVAGSLRRALTLGRALIEAQEGDDETLRAVDGVRVVAQGLVSDVRRDPGVEVRGVASIRQQGTRPEHPGPVRLDIANEYLTVICGGELVASAPDIIGVLDPSWNPVPAEDLRPGQRVRVMSVAAPEGLREVHDSSLAVGRVGFGLASRGYHPVGA